MWVYYVSFILLGGVLLILLQYLFINCSLKEDKSVIKLKYIVYIFFVIREFDIVCIDSLEFFVIVFFFISKYERQRLFLVMIDGLGICDG